MTLVLLLVRMIVGGAMERLPEKEAPTRREQKRSRDEILIFGKVSERTLEPITRRQKNGSQNPKTRDMTEPGPRRSVPSSPHGPSLGARKDRKGHPLVGRDGVQ